MAALHIDKVETIVIENGVVCVSVVSEEEIIKWKMPLLVFRRGVSLACKTLADHDASGEVIVFQRHS